MHEARPEVRQEEEAAMKKVLYVVGGALVGAAGYGLWQVHKMFERSEFTRSFGATNCCGGK